MPLPSRDAGPVRKVRRRRPTPRPAPQMRRFSPPPPPRPRRTVAPRTDIQTERPGQGGRRRSSTEPTKRQVRQARIQGRQYGSPKVSDRMARQNRATALRNRERRRALLMRARRRRLFPKDNFRAFQESARGAIQSLADLKAQDPEKYERKQRSWASNAIDDVGSYVKKRLETTDLTDPQNKKQSVKVVKDLANAADKGLKAGARVASEGIGDIQKQGLGIPVVDDLAKEALDLTANTPTGLYLSGAAAVEAGNELSSRAVGRRVLPGGKGFRRGKGLIKDFEKSSALAPLVKGDLKEAAKRAQDRPLTTALELSGAKALVGRGTGAAARKAPSKTLRQIGSTERAPQSLYTPAETRRRVVRGKTPVGGAPGPKVGREYSRDLINKGLQVAGEKIKARRGRDPNVDYGTRHPATMTGRRIRRQLERRVDTRAFSQQRAAEQARHRAARVAKEATGAHKERLLLAARADKIRTELRTTAANSASGQRRRALLALTKLPDRKLVARVEHGGAPRMKKASSRMTPFSQAEQANAAKSIMRRARRGRPLSPALQEAYDAAVQSQVARDVARRKAGPTAPGAPLAEAVANVALGKVPPVPPVLRGPQPLRAADFEQFFKGARHRKAIPPRRVEAPKDWQRLAAIRAADEDILPTAVNRAVRQAVEEGDALTAAEFGIPVGKRGYSRSFGAAQRQATKVNKQDPNVDLVPFRAAPNKYVLVPRVVAERFEKHAAVDRSSLTGTPFETGTRLFKDVVLTTSGPSRWIGGNIADIGVRSALEGLTPLDWMRGRAIDRRLREEHGLQGQQASADTTGGGLMGIADDLAQLAPTTKYNVPAKGWRAWKRGIYTVEHAIEKSAQHARVGKDFRRHNQRQLTDMRGLLKLQEEALDRYARGLATDRAMEARVAKHVEDLIGRWGKVSPAMRRTLALAPFAQWLGASTRYVWVTLPVHHPIKTGILAGIMQMTEPERRRLGLSYFAEPAARADDYQMGLLPTEVINSQSQVREYAREKGLTDDEAAALFSAAEHGPVVRGLRTSRMTSGGTAANPGEWPNFALPQFSGAFNALTGTSFTGEPLEFPEWYPEERRGIGLDLPARLPVALGAQLETAIPFASAFRRSVLERGNPSMPYSTILTPEVRRKYDYDRGVWVEPKGSALQGLKKWAMPIAPEGRVYTLGAQRDIEATQKAMKKIHEWNEERKKPRTVDIFRAPEEYEPEDKRDIFTPPKPHAKRDRRDIFEAP